MENRIKNRSFFQDFTLYVSLVVGVCDYECRQEFLIAWIFTILVYLQLSKRKMWRWNEWTRLQLDCRMLFVREYARERHVLTLPMIRAKNKLKLSRNKMETKIDEKTRTSNPTQNRWSIAIELWSCRRYMSNRFCVDTCFAFFIALYKW